MCSVSRGAQIDYQLEDGRSLFGGPVAVDADTLLGLGADSGRTLRLVIPPHYRDQGSGSREYDGGGRSIVGFFGPGSSGKKVCYSNGVTPIPNTFVDATNSTTMTWSPLVSTPTAADVYVESVGGQRGGSVGTLDVNGLCATAGTRFVDYLSVSQKYVTSNDEVLAFKGPFQLNVANGNYDAMSGTVASGVLTLNWNYLPGVQSNAGLQGIDGVDIYARIETSPGQNEDYRSDDGVNCAGLGSYGFTQLKDQPVVNPTVVAASTSISSIPTPLATAFNSGLATVIACPYLKDAALNKRYYSSAAIIYPHGSGTNFQMATSYIVKGPQFPGASVVVTGICTPFVIQGRNGGRSAYFPPNQMLNLTPDSNMLLYTDPTCGSGPVTSMPVGGLEQNVYVKISDTGSHTLSTVDPTSALSGGGNMAITSQAPPSPVTQVVAIFAPTAVVAYGCYPFTLQSWHDYPAGDAVMYPLAGTQTFYFATTDLDVYLDSGNSGICEANLVPSIQLGPTTLEVRGHFRYRGTSTFNFMPTSSSGGNFTGTYAGGTNLTVTQPGAVSAIEMQMTGNVSNGQCVPVDFVLTDSAGNRAAATTVSLSLSSGSGSFYSSIGCSASTIYANISGGNSSATVYFMSTTAGPTTITATSTMPALTVSRTVTVGF